MRRGALILPVLLTACSAPPPAVEGALATVNGVAITAAELDLLSRPATHGAPAASGDRKAVLQTAIRQELAAQRAAELGLDQDPAYREELARMQAQIAAFRRQRLSELYEEKELARRAAPGEEDVLRYFEEHAAELRTQVHVMQILSRSEEKVRTARAEIAAGADFEAVAAAQFPDLPESAGRPWDLGYLRWSQVPDAWREALSSLPAGGVSEVITSGSRSWIVKLVARREDPSISLETERPLVVEQLRHARLAELRAEGDLALRRQARIVYAAP